MSGTRSPASPRLLLPARARSTGDQGNSLTFPLRFDYDPPLKVSPPRVLIIPCKERRMQIEERTVGTVKVLDVKGQIIQGDLLLKDKINSVVNQGHKQILVNLADVSYVDSAGL